MSNSKLIQRAKTTSKIPKIMVFRPTLEQMDDFSSYIEFMESKGAHKAGLAKIIPPAGWKARQAGYEDIIESKKFKIKNPIKQEMRGKNGIFQAYNIEKKTVSVFDFKKMAENRNSTPNYYDYDDLERKYWANIHYTPPYYGADMQGSLYDDDCERFNIQKLGTCLDMINDEYGISIAGVNTPYLYFGMWKATFAWHTEDCDLYSINYLHYGLPKSWYAIPPEYGFKFEEFCKSIKEPNFHGSFDICPAFLRHKTSVIQPSVLKEHQIPFNKITQETGEFMITFPFSYHCGYNHGYNCAESTNFALPRWVEYGKRASQCTCRNESVHINMECFIKKYQPERYQLWLEGKDIGCHPEDPLKRMKPAPSPYCPKVEEDEPKPKSKRQAAAKCKKSKKSKKRKTDDCELFNTACLDELDLPYSPNQKQPKKKQKKKCEDTEPTSSIQSNLAINNLSIVDNVAIKHPKIIIKRDHQLTGFLQSSALDRLSEETKINVTISMNNNNLGHNVFNSNMSINDSSPSSIASSTSSNQTTFPTKAALKQYDFNTSQSINVDNNQTANCDIPKNRPSVSPDRPEDPRLSSERYSLFNSNSPSFQNSSNNQTKHTVEHQPMRTLSPEPFKSVTMNTDADNQPSNTFINKIILNSASKVMMPQSFDVRATQCSNIRTEIKINNSGDSDALE